nr:hypothetical protein [Armatimonadota bacterium]
MKIAAVATLSAALMVGAQAAGESVYRNGPEDGRATNFFQPGQVHETTGYFQEWGDEVTLVGANRNVTEMTVYYATDLLIPTGNERIRIRFYAPDGPAVGSPPRPSPGTLLWDSGSLAVYTGWRSQRFPVPDVIVPETFIWTAAFEGPDGNPGNRIGLYYFGPPSVGASDISVWQRSDPGEGWSYNEWDYSNGTTPYGSFGATLWANGGPEGTIFDTMAATSRTEGVMN